jgi:Putative quorum-sensing-regulated virulence factor
MPLVASAFRLGDMERKLLRLALSPSAQGEITTSAIKLINTLRARGVESGAIENALEGSGEENTFPVISRPDWGMTMLSFGKHKGEMLMDIPPSYLRWVLRWISESPERGASPMLGETAHAIEQFFKQAEQR